MLKINLSDPHPSFSPGQQIPVKLEWSLEKPTEKIELRLVWNTVGKGDQDLSVEQTWRYLEPRPEDYRTEMITLPEGPYSCSGKLLSVVWAFELIEFPSADSTRVEFTLGPGGREARLSSASAESN